MQGKAARGEEEREHPPGKAVVQVVDQPNLAGRGECGIRSRAGAASACAVNASAWACGVGGLPRRSSCPLAGTATAGVAHRSRCHPACECRRPA
jgi:hypothetical protein